jgi:PAB1-binding protein PBP1
MNSRSHLYLLTYKGRDKENFTITINRTSSTQQYQNNNARRTYEDWQSPIVQNLHIIDHRGLIDLVTSDNDIFIASDGGVCEYLGTFE